MYAVIVFHKNVNQYPKEWITEFKHSIDNQTIPVDVFELNYGGGSERIFTYSNFESKELKNHAEAMNYLLDKVFDLGYEYVFNTNVDDKYDLKRFETQMKYSEYDIVSSNFELDNGHIYSFDKLNIKKELQSNHNIICHPVIMISKHFWSYNRYKPNEIPFEDMKLWQRSIGSFKFIILPKVLCYHRVHLNSVGHG